MALALGLDQLEIPPALKVHRDVVFAEPGDHWFGHFS
jgi:hypothetical protein